MLWFQLGPRFSVTRHTSQEILGKTFIGWGRSEWGHEEMGEKEEERGEGVTQIQQEGDLRWLGPLKGL